MLNSICDGKDSGQKAESSNKLENNFWIGFELDFE